ncbi:hypothetical protein HHI36_001845 [Cryptolaemus montrouzieri]|uniref:GST N-terminal domain-containing protein n=1 Tax=Cryptolaemus montrouzieri TaxID=559131 RepID=A0ABD2P8S0_9CUCU
MSWMISVNISNVFCISNNFILYQLYYHLHYYFIEVLTRSSFNYGRYFASFFLKWSFSSCSFGNKSSWFRCRYSDCQFKEKEQLKDEYLKINPQHTVPTLVDGDFILWDSHAIGTYLADTYGKNDSFYPKDLRRRALVDQRLNFDCGTMYPRIRAICAVGWDIAPYGNVSKWLTRCSLEIPDYYNANQVGAEAFGKAVRSKLAPGQI